MKKLTNKLGEIIPSIGLGTFPFQGQEMCDMVLNAVRIGYRLFDTSDDYRGETGLGMAVTKLSQSKEFSRESLFLQTKISDNNAYADEQLIGVYFNPKSNFMQRHSVEDIVREKVATSLRKMQTDYIDSLLIHYPYPEYYVDIWKVMIKLKSEGLIRYIGVSNFHERHIEKLIGVTGVCPDINEIYISPIGSKGSLVKYSINHECLPVTYSPLMDVSSNRIPKDVIRPIMEKYKKSMAQIILRWNIDRGCLPLPKTKNKSRLEENFNIFDFSLTKDEIDVVSSLNRDYQYLIESKICPGL